MYAKLVEGVLVESPKVLFDSRRTYSNPLPETLVAFGYKPVVEQEKPEDKEGFYQVSHYEENDSEITLVWEYIEIPVEDETVEDEVVEEPVVEEPVVEDEMIEEESVEEPVVEEGSDAEPTVEAEQDVGPQVEEQPAEEEPVSEPDTQAEETMVEETEEPVEE